MLEKRKIERMISKKRGTGVVSSNATAIARDAAGRAALHGHASLASGPFRGTRPLDPARWTRRPPVWIIYSGCIPGNFRGAVLRWLRSFIAGSPPSTTLPSSSSASTFARASQLPLPVHGHFSRARGTSSFRAARRRCDALHSRL